MSTNVNKANLVIVTENVDAVKYAKEIFNSTKLDKIVTVSKWDGKDIITTKSFINIVKQIKEKINIIDARDQDYIELAVEVSRLIRISTQVIVLVNDNNAVNELNKLFIKAA